VKDGTFYGQQMTADDIYTIAGNGQFGFSGNGGPALDAEFQDPVAMAVDASGNIAIADDFNKVIWGGAAAAGTPDSLGDGGPATQARLGLVSEAISPSAT